MSVAFLLFLTIYHHIGLSFLKPDILYKGDYSLFCSFLLFTEALDICNGSYGSDAGAEVGRHPEHVQGVREADRGGTEGRAQS